MVPYIINPNLKLHQNLTRNSLRSCCAEDVWYRQHYYAQFPDTMGLGSRDQKLFCCVCVVDHYTPAGGIYLVIAMMIWSFTACIWLSTAQTNSKHQDNNCENYKYVSVEYWYNMTPLLPTLLLFILRSHPICDEIYPSTFFFYVPFVWTLVQFISVLFEFLHFSSILSVTHWRSMRYNHQLS